MRRTSLKYYFSVEGETEIRYFKWLEQIINNCKKANKKVKFIVKNLTPISFAKSINQIVPVEAFHINDVESLSDYHIKRFKAEIDEMNEVTKKMGRKIEKYDLGYTNLTFELWMLLHVSNEFRSYNRNSDYVIPLNKCFNKNYESIREYKSEKEFQGLLDTLGIDNVIKAIKRAKRIEKMNIDKGYTKRHHRNASYYIENPSLSIHEIVEKILMDVGILTNSFY